MDPINLRVISHHQDYDPATGRVADSFTLTLEPSTGPDQRLTLTANFDPPLTVGTVYLLTAVELTPA